MQQRVGPALRDSGGGDEGHGRGVRFEVRRHAKGTVLHLYPSRGTKTLLDFAKLAEKSPLGHLLGLRAGWPDSQTVESP